MRRNEVIETYLDDLLGRLHGSPSDVRRMLGETELHLYAALEDGMSHGLDESSAARQALIRFGPVARVAHEWNVSAPTGSLLGLLRRLADDLAPLAGIGLVAIGISGLLARLMSVFWGSRFVFADPPGTRYPAGSCHRWLSIHPHAANCTSAYLAESLADATLARYLAGALGVGLLAITAIIRRRRGFKLFASTSALAAFTAAALFGVATIALVGLGADDLRVARGMGRDSGSPAPSSLSPSPFYTAGSSSASPGARSPCRDRRRTTSTQDTIASTTRDATMT